MKIASASASPAISASHVTPKLVERRQVQARRLAAGLGHAQFTVTVSGGSGCDVAGVEFYAGAVRLASLTSTPYSFDWNNVPVGTHVVTTISTDAGARVPLSEPLTFRVNAPPTISLTSPPAGASYNRPVNITISATAADTDGTVSRVDFYANGVLIGTDTTAPYSIVWGNAPAGSHSLTATATDNNSGQTTSAARSITVN